MKNKSVYVSVFLTIMAGVIMHDPAKSDDMEDHVFIPYASAKIHVQGQLEKFDDLVDDFARSRGLLVARGNYPKDDRSVDNVEIDVDTSRRTHIGLSNRRDAGVFDGSVYSHEDRKIWEPLWHDFLKALSDKFGNGAVEIIEVH